MTDAAPIVALRDRIAAYIVGQIVSGTWLAGERIPSESAFTAQFGASRMTVHHALRDLTQRGFLRRHKGLGSFVAEPRPYVSHYDHLDIIEEIEDRGARHTARVVRQELRPAHADEAEEFGLAKGAPLFHAIVVHCKEGLPLELEDRLLNPEILPECMSVNLAKRSLFSLLMLSRPFRDGVETMRAILPAAEDQTLLGLRDPVPCLEIVRKTWSNDGVVTRVRLVRSGSSASAKGRIAAAPFDSASGGRAVA